MTRYPLEPQKEHKKNNVWLQAYRRITVVLVAALSYFLILGFTLPCNAMDDDGCMTCHKFPGLVRRDETKKIKMLHISEKDFRGSLHGKSRCKSCHAAVDQVPHTGKNQVTCKTIECHAKDQVDSLTKTMPLNSFHEKGRSTLSSIQDPSSCRVCHDLFPHSQSHMVRAFLNMHTGYLACETCHLNKEKYQNLTYGWREPEQVKFIGEKHGSVFNEKTGQVERAGEAASRIAPYELKGGQKRLLVNTWDNAKAIEFLQKRGQLDKKEEADQIRFFHKDMRRRAISVACQECHAPDSILDFKELGFGDKRKEDLVYMNIRGLVTKYETFYFPQLFGK